VYEIVVATKRDRKSLVVPTTYRSTCRTTQRHVPRTRGRGNLSHVASGKWST